MELLDLKDVIKLLADSKECLIGVSGGIDSMCMLHWFTKNRDKLPCKIKAMHIDHGINAASSDWANFVSQQCEDFGIEHSIVKVSLEGLGNNVEYAARKARYKAFCESGADSVILAHHANDQCESFLLKLFRGSGIRGLKSMIPRASCWYDSTVTVVRPLLDVSRIQIEEYAECHGISNIEDSSNDDDNYDRNYIRNKVWPTILDRFAIADVNTIRSIKHLDEAWQLTTVLADNDIASTTMPDGSLDWYKLRDLGYLRIKNMILRILAQENIYSFSIWQVEKFANGLINADLNNRTQLIVKGLTMQKVGKKINIVRDIV